MKWIYAVIFFWVTFVVSLAGWWLYFGIQTLGRAADLGVENQLARHQRMLFMEGCVLLIFLIGGGLALFYFSYRMYKEKSAKEIFFASFTHDIKTALFRLQLEAEKLEVDEILTHTRRMQLNLENSLDSAIGQKKTIFVEKVNFKNFLTELHTQWPELHIKFSGEDFVPADRKALHSIFRNLFHNSFMHGHADEVSVEIKKEAGKYTLKYHDNGKEYVGNLENLGRITHSTSGGSGFGLYIVRQWVKRLGGRIQFFKGPKSSLEVSIELPGRSL